MLNRVLGCRQSAMSMQATCFGDGRSRLGQPSQAHNMYWELWVLPAIGCDSYLIRVDHKAEQSLKIP